MSKLGRRLRSDWSCREDAQRSDQANPREVKMFILLLLPVLVVNALPFESSVTNKPPEVRISLEDRPCAFLVPMKGQGPDLKARVTRVAQSETSKVSIQVNLEGLGEQTDLVNEGIVEYCLKLGSDDRVLAKGRCEVLNGRV